MPVRAYLYDADGTDSEVRLNEQVVANLNDKHLLWIDVTGGEKTEWKQVTALFGLHPEAVSNALSPAHQPRVDNYGDHYHVNVNALKVVEKRLGTTELDFIVGKNFVITTHREPVAFLEKFEEQVKDDSQLGQLNAPLFLATLLDWHISDYFRAIEALETEIDRLDERALTAHFDERMLSELVSVRRRVAHIRRALTPHREVTAALARPDFQTTTTEKSGDHLRSLNARLERAIDAVENARELLIGSFEIYMAQTTLRTNHIIKVLTLTSVVFFVAGVTASLMSMNFKIALYDTGAKGFAGVLAFILLTSAAVVAAARWRRWI